MRFLNARLDEESDLALRCGGGHSDGDGCGQWAAHGHTVDFCQLEVSGPHPTIALHVALHDPARVLREAESRRRVLTRHSPVPVESDAEPPREERQVCQLDNAPWPCDDVRDLAAPYSDHPDFPHQA